jgi:putative membrane protein
MMRNNTIRFAIMQNPTKTFAVFYTVGLLLFAVPATREMFLLLTPFSLLLVTAAVLILHNPLDTKFIVISSSIVVISYTLEVTGVKTGVIFGQYIYLTALGPKIMGTPIIIGINWLMLTYCSASLTNLLHTRTRTRQNFFTDVTFGAVIMLLYDLLLEQVAPHMNMWVFKKGDAPLANYTTWFIAAFLFHFTYRIAGIKFDNKPAAHLIVIQTLFFAAIYIYLHIII